MAKSTRRVEFSAKIKNLVARRAGYSCSFLGCERPTCGPGAQSDKAINMGEAAHIFSASPNGPRGNGGLREEELASPSNAIWLCPQHAELIDKAQGTAYPAELLIHYRDLHEAKIMCALGGIKPPLGWVVSLHADASPLFAPKTKITLGKLTLIIGNDAVGKTALSEWFAGVSEAHYLNRWHPDKRSPNGLRFRVEYLDPSPHTIRVEFLRDGIPRYYLDETFTIVPVAPLKVFFPKDVDSIVAISSGDDLASLADALRLSEYEVRSLAEEVPSQGTGKVSRAWFDRSTGSYKLHADVEGTVPGLPFRSLSGSEQTRVLMEFCIVAAKQYARLQPTLLILDSGSRRFDTEWLKSYGQILRSPDIPFQTIASIAPRADMEALTWAGWQTIRLTGEPPNVRISKKIRLASDDLE